MAHELDTDVREACRAVGNDRARLLDVCRTIQGRF